MIPSGPHSTPFPAAAPGATTDLVTDQAADEATEAESAVNHAGIKEVERIPPRAIPKVAPEDVGLRAAPRPVIRLNRRTLAGLAAGLATLVLGSTLWSLRPPAARVESKELYNVEQLPPSASVTELPSDYSKLLPSSERNSEIPALGPPLPGDLGPAIVRSQNSAITGYAAPGEDAALAEHDALRKEAETAAASSVFFRSGQQPAGMSADLRSLSSQKPDVPDAQAGDAGATAAHEASRGPRGPLDQNRSPESRLMQTAAQAADHRLPASPYQVMAGTVIAAALVTGIQSDLPGEVIGILTEPVYDTATGQHLLIPQGSRILGKYNNAVGFGQRRVQVVWTRIILPDTSSMTLDNLIGTDLGGYAGLEDGVDWHSERLIAGAALTTLLGVGAELVAPENRQNGDRVIIAGRGSLQNSVNHAGQELTRRNLDVQPTLTLRPGLPLRIIVNRDLVLQPYRPLFFPRRTSP